MKLNQLLTENAPGSSDLGTYSLRFELELDWRDLNALQTELKQTFTDVAISSWEWGLDFKCTKTEPLEKIIQFLKEKKEGAGEKYQKTFVNQGYKYLVNKWLAGKELVGIAPNIECDLVLKSVYPSFKNINKHIRHINGKIYIYGAFYGPAMGLLKIDGLKEIVVLRDDEGVDKASQQAANIFNECLSGKIDFLDCQERLLDNHKTGTEKPAMDLSEFAKM